jgi:hypothetical protein
MDRDSQGMPTRTTLPVEVALAAANLAVAGWCVWAALNSAGVRGPRDVSSRYSWIAQAYLVEILVLGLLVLLSVARRGGSDARWLRALWASLGALTALAVLGAWSVGPLLLPGVVLVFITGWLAAVRTGSAIAPLLAWGVAGLLGQVGVMALVIATVLAAG